MEMIMIAGVAVFALLLIQHRKSSPRRPARLRARRDEPSTRGQTDVPEDRC